MDFLSVLYQAFMSFVVLFILSKILGKKQVAQLEFIDYVVGISIGSIAAQMAIEPEVPYYHFIIAMTIYALLDLFITLVSRKANFLKKLFKGKPLIIINQGEIDYKTLKKSKLDINELISKCRVKGFFNLTEINYCIFEPSGDFSIMPKGQNSPLQKQDMKIKEEDAQLNLYLIIDGSVNNQALKQIEKDETWLLKNVNLTKKELKKVMLCSYNIGDNSFNVYNKK